MSYSLHAAWLAAFCLAFTAGCEVDTVDQPTVETNRPVIDEDDVDRPTPLPADDVDTEVNETEVNETEINETDVNNPAVTPVEPANEPNTTNDIDLNVDDSADPVPLNNSESEDPAAEAPAQNDSTTGGAEPEADQPE